ncbi:hypothetical protein Pelo_5121 [Pelomyxa schiedti]|nr:hypothetical protein Pelo_5121 [Pelomyxa schiedti]
MTGATTSTAMVQEWNPPVMPAPAAESLGTEAVIQQPQQKAERHLSAAVSLTAESLGTEAVIQQPQQKAERHLSAAVSLSAREQFVSLLMVTHPRCGKLRSLLNFMVSSSEVGSSADASSPSSLVLLSLPSRLHRHHEEYQEQQRDGNHLAIRIVWEYCHQVTMLFSVPVEPDSTIPFSCVAQFRVSAILGSVIGDDVRWVCGSVGRKVINANQWNVVECKNGDHWSYSLRNIESGKSLPLVYFDCHPFTFSHNAKWFFFLFGGITPSELPSVVIASIREKNPQEGMLQVKLPTEPYCSAVGWWTTPLNTQFFFSNTRPDEGILCSILELGYSGEWKSFSIDRVHVEKSWSTPQKKLTALSVTTCTAKFKLCSVRAAFVLFKESGSRVYVFDAWHSDVGMFKVEEGSSSLSVLSSPLARPPQRGHSVMMSQLGESQFCVWHPGVVEIWDINNCCTTTSSSNAGAGGGPLRMIECAGMVNGLIAEGGLFFSSCSCSCGSGPMEEFVQVTSPSTGALILTLSGVRSTPLSLKASSIQMW